jgi:hypothetical protein
MRKQNYRYKIVRHLVVFSFLVFALPFFVFAQEPQTLRVPDTLEEAKEQSLSVGNKIAGILPGVVQNIWETQVLPVWRNMWKWTQEELWQKRVQPVAQNLIDKGKVLLGREVEQRRPIIEQELQKEKQELSEELKTHTQNTGKSIWERFKDLFRKN